MRIGVDFGGTYIKAALVEGATVVRFERAETDPGASQDAILDLIAFTVRQLYATPEQVGLAIPGEVDSDGRCWRLPNVAGFDGVHIARDLQQRLECPVTVENDAIAAALAERLYGVGAQHKSFLLLTLGTGIGGGLVLDGTIRRGANGFAGEIGHLCIDSSESAWVCGCGQRGCMEAYAGRTGLMRKLKEGGGSAETIKQIAESARTGEAAAKAVFEMMGDALGRGLAAIQNTLDLDAVVFTGGVAQSFDLIEPSLRAALKARAFAKPLAEVPLLVSALGEHAGVIGAANLPTKKATPKEPPSGQIEFGPPMDADKRR